MTVDDMLDLLAPVGVVTARRMFGGTGFYKEGLMFALEAGGRLYVKVDDESRAKFEDAGCERFTIEMGGKVTGMSYYEPPESAFSSELRMKPWALLGVQASLRAAAKSKPKTKKNPGVKKAAAVKKPRKTK